MSNIVLLGGNGYIGRNVTAKWLALDPEAQFFVVSRSGKNELIDSRATNVIADVTNVEDMLAKLPEQINYIVDFVGRPENDPVKFEEINRNPALAMLQIAQAKKAQAMGFIGGILGPKSFVEGKRKIGDELRASDIRTEIVEPTIVHGNGRSDAMSKIVPVLKFLGMFSKKLKPVHVDDVADEMVKKMTGRS